MRPKLNILLRHAIHEAEMQKHECVRLKDFETGARYRDISKLVTSAREILFDIQRKIQLAAEDEINKLGSLPPPEPDYVPNVIEPPKRKGWFSWLFPPKQPNNAITRNSEQINALAAKVRSAETRIQKEFRE